jgi:hypothetical protein
VYLPKERSRCWHFEKKISKLLLLLKPLDEYPVNQALSSNEPISNLVIGILRPDKEKPCWAQCDAYQVRETDGTLQQIVVTFFDITAVAEAGNRIAFAVVHDDGERVIAYINKEQ